MFAILVLVFVDGVSACTVEVINIKTKYLSGHVIDKLGGSIPQAKVAIYKDSEYKDLIAETMSDDEGRYHLNSPMPGRYTLKVTGGNFWLVTIATLRYSRPSLSTAAGELAITLVGPGECSGSVEVRKLKGR
jgi:hypothetical protein